MPDMNSVYDGIYLDFDLDMSLPLSEASEADNTGRDFMDYYIQMEQILEMERSTLEENRNQLQADLKAEEEQEEIDYYVRQYEENQMDIWDDQTS